MSTTSERVYVARLVNTSVFDPIGDAVGRVRDVVILMRRGAKPVATGLVVEVPGRRRVFMPLTRVTSIAPGQVICNGVVNLRRFQARTSETLAMAELFERSVRLKEDKSTAYIEDIAIEPDRTKQWVVTKLYVRKAERRKGVLGFSRRGEAVVVDVDQVTGLAQRDKNQGAAMIIQQFVDHKPADLAAALMEMAPSRSAEIAAALDDERLADVLEELPEEDQIALLNTLQADRAADVLEAMEPDDAADLRVPCIGGNQDACHDIGMVRRGGDRSHLRDQSKSRPEEVLCPIPTKGGCAISSAPSRSAATRRAAPG